MDLIALLGPLAKPIGDILVKFAEGVIVKRGETLSVLTKLATDEGRLDFSKAHLSLFKEIGKHMPVDAVEGAIDNYSLFELLVVCDDIFNSLKKTVETEFEKTVKKNIKECLINWLTVTGKYSDDPYYEKFRNLVIDDSFVFEVSNREFSSGNKISEYPDKIYFSQYSGDVSKKEEYNAFYDSFVRACVAEAKTMYKNMAFISTVNYSGGKSTFLLGGYGGVSENEIILTELFNSTLRNEKRKGTEHLVAGIVGTDTYNYVISKNVLNGDITFDLREVAIIYSGIISSILTFCKLIKRHRTSEKEQVIEIIVCQSQENVAKRALSGTDWVNIIVQ